MGDAMTASGGASDCFVEGFDRRRRTLRVVPDSRDDGQEIGPGADQGRAVFGRDAADGDARHDHQFARTLRVGKSLMDVEMQR